MAIEIQTTQNVTLRLREAGLGPRILARLLDTFFIVLWVLGGMVIFGSAAIGLSSGSGILIIILLIYLPIIFYDLLLECLNNGQSFGKKIMQIQVVNLDGTTPSFGTYLIRWLFRLVDFSLTGGALAVIMVAFTDKSQRLGDLLAGTTVITLKPENSSESIGIPDVHFNEQYVATYPDVLDKLNDQDIETVRSILGDYRYYNDYNTIGYLANKIKNVTGYVFEGNDRDFLKKILDDYNHMSMME